MADETINETDGSITDGSGIVYRRMADIKPEPIRWLWPQIIPRGKMTIIAGYPDLGKSQVAIDIAAGVSNGTTTGAVGRVIFVCAEDDAADTIRPRLEAAGANLDNIIIIDAVSVTVKEKKTRRGLNLQEDIERLFGLLGTLGTVDLVVIDPISAYMGKIDSHKNADVRGVLTPLAELATRHDVAILCISHLNKSKDMNAMMRITGSQAYVAAARAAYLVAADPDDEERRLFLRIKCNLSKLRTGLAFRIASCKLENNIETSRVVWEEGTFDITADEVLAEQPKTEDTPALMQAIIFLCVTLANGEQKATDVCKMAAEENITERTLKRAKREIRIKSQKGDDGWLWELPKGAKNAKGANSAKDAKKTKMWFDDE